MSPRIRRLIFVTAALAVGAVILRGFVGLPGFGNRQSPYGQLLNRYAVAERHATNVVAAVLFDYRALDTLGEEFILFAAAVAASLLLRAQWDEKEAPAGTEEGARPDRRVPPVSDAVRAITLGLLGSTVLFGVYLVVHGQLSPGGGFQGGLAIATAWVLIYLADEVDTFRRLTPEPVLDTVEAAGAASFVLVGLAGLLFGGALLKNIVPLGRPGALLSGGTILVLNVAVGVAVTAAFLSVFVIFLRQTFLVREPD